MNFPIQSQISPVPYGPQKLATSLTISGNAGQIPPAFQYAVVTDDNRICDIAVIQLTQEQWSSWTNQDDSTYILACVASLLGLTLEQE